ncbi:MAG: nitrate/sulfonate/bicarbonate ABC transporter ATP-binding protein [Acidobacteria bacterium]|nr:nitrate/sulfonate/bicarbonate ABC transporter ATP-binding protein [Acidobacteriota bacterium]
MSAPICELRGVQKSFQGPKGKEIRVLEDVNLKVLQDEILAIVGPNGSGKSTLLRLMAGLAEPTRGEIRFHRQRLVGLNPGVAMVFQDFALYPWMTVEQNVRVVLQARDLPDEEVRQKAHEAIRKVGLEGFEEAYPRELSRGSKQRVGVARALAVDPEILVMDEPFSQVDALTAEALRAEILDIWEDAERNPSSIVLVSHSLREAVLLADRIVVLSGNPSHIRTILPVPLSRPRNPRSPEFMRLVDKLHDIITSAELPDVEVSAPSMANLPEPIEPLPHVGSPDILGLMEFLEAQGGQCDLFVVASQTHVPFEFVLTTVKAAEMLDFVDTPKRSVKFTDIGKRFLTLDMDARKDLWREQLLKLRLFRVVMELLDLREGRLHKEELLHEIAHRLPTENAEQTFGTLVAWARFGELFAYREDEAVITPE